MEEWLVLSLRWFTNTRHFWNSKGYAEFVIKKDQSEELMSFFLGSQTLTGKVVRLLNQAYARQFAYQFESHGFPYVESCF